MNDSIFRPHWNTTKRISNWIEGIDRQRYLVENMLLMPKYEAWIRREVSHSRVAATTAIEGVGIGTEAVSRLDKYNSKPNPSEAETANRNAIRAYEFVDYLTGQDDLRVDELVIRELHRQFMQGLGNQLTPGSYRKGQNKVLGFMPPNQGDVPALMRALANWLAEDKETHPLTKAGLAHIEFVAIHPFWDGNGRVARALMTLIMQRLGYGFKGLLSIESVFANQRDDYIVAIEKSVGSTYRASYDATPWLEYFFKSIWVAAGLLVDKLTDWRKMMDELRTDARGTGLLDRHADVIMYAARVSHITRADYIEITGVSPVTASRDLQLLVDRGLFEAEGKTRSRIYRLVREPGGEPRTDEDLQPPLPFEGA